MGNCYTKQIDPSKFKSYDDQMLTEELRKTRNTISFKFNQQRVRTKEEVLQQYQIKKQLGKGLFSKVYLAYNQEGKQIALKIVKKKNFLQKDSIHKILIEKDIMKILNHENILKLYKTIQSNSILFFELEYASLGSLLNVINTKLYLEVEEIQFIVAQIIEGLLYMHQRKIVYGDLKAENVLLNDQGIIKICDFNLSGTATLLKNQFQGTKIYMAPELIDNNEKTYASDFWSLGVLVHLLYYRKYPFSRKTQSDLFFNILNGNIIEEDKRKAPKNLRKFIMDLLVVNSSKRLGKSFQDFVDHPFFHKFDWKNYKKSSVGINLVQDLQELNENKKRKRSSNKDRLNTLMDTSQNNFLYDIQNFTYEDNDDSELFVLSTSSGDKTKQKGFSDTNSSWNSKQLKSVKKTRVGHINNRIEFLERKMEEQKNENDEKFSSLKHSIQQLKKNISNEFQKDQQNVNNQTDLVFTQIENNLAIIQQETKTRKNNELKMMSQLDKKFEVCKNYLQVEQKNRIDDLDKIKKQIDQEIPLIEEGYKLDLQLQEQFLEEIKQKFLAELSTVDENQQNIKRCRQEQEEALKNMIIDIEQRTKKELKDLESQRKQSQKDLEGLLDNALNKVSQAINKQF